MSPSTRIAAITVLLGVLVAAPAPAAPAPSAPAAAAPSPGIPQNALDRMDRDLVGCWSLGEGIPGDQVLNRAGGPLHGTRYGAERGDGALRFDGIDDYVSIRPHWKLASLHTGTISVWFKARSAKWGECIQPILYFGDPDGGSDNSSLIVELGHFWPDRKTTALYFTIYGLPGQRPTFCFDLMFDLDLDAWYHFVAVVGEGFNTGYLNGVEMTERNYNFGGPNDTAFFDDVVDPGSCLLGKGWFYTYPAPCYFDGEIGEVRVFRRPLGASEVRDLYHETRRGPVHTAAAFRGQAAPQAASTERPVAFLQNQPNPFIGSTVIRFSAATRGKVALKVFDVSGREVRTLADGIYGGGIQVLRWDGKDNWGRAVSSGVYFCEIRTPELTKRSKMVVAH